MIKEKHTEDHRLKLRLRALESEDEVVAVLQYPSNRQRVNRMRERQR